MTISIRLITSLVAVLYLEYNRIWSLANYTNPVCLSPECKKFAEYILQNIDNRVDPCHNFYDFVCRGWEKNHPRPKHAIQWNAEEYVYTLTLGHVRTILEDPKISKNPRIQDAKVLYNLCKNIPHLEKVTPAEAREIILGIHDWPNFMCNDVELPDSLPVWDIDNYYFKRTGNSAFISYGIHLMPGTEQQILVDFHSSASFYGMVLRFTKWTDVEEKHYKQFLGHVIETILPGNLKTCKGKIPNIVKKVFKFREELSELALKLTRETPEPMTLKEVQDWYRTLSKPVKNARINWPNYFHTICKSRRNSHGQNLRVDDPVFVQKQYFVELAKLLLQTPTDVIVNHIHLYFAESHIWPTPEMEASLIKTITNNYPATGLVRYHPERWQTCIESSTMIDTLARMYTDDHLSRTAREDVQKLVEEAKELLKMQIFSSTWLNSETKAMTIKKIDHVETVIGYPTWIEKMKTINLRPPNIPPLAPDVQYMVQLNFIYISASYLQIPIYSPHMPYVVSYGATVSMLGHELYHTVDAQGILYDERSRNPWWKSDMITKHHKISKCFKEQYSKRKERELAKRGAHMEVDGMITLSEDIADAMGLKLAYMGFKHKLLQKKDWCPILPGFEKRGCEQLFFILFGNAFCEASKDADIRNLLTNIHSAPNIRVNGAVSNMKEFSKAFKCKKGDRMYAEKPCDLWHKEL